MKKVAVIGAGLTGSLVAYHLSQNNVDVHVFDKARGKGGRASTKILPWGQFDLGVPVIPASDPQFIEFMEHLVDVGNAHHWPEMGKRVLANSVPIVDKQAPTFVFDAKMNSICHYCLQDSEFSPNSLVSDIRFHSGSGWNVCIEGQWFSSYFDGVVCAVPWPQAQMFVDKIEEKLTPESQNWASCWVVGLALECNELANFHFSQFDNNPVQTLVFDSQKPNRPGPINDLQIWVAHLNHTLSAELGKANKEQAIAIACEHVCEQLRLPASAIKHTYGHFWRYARSEKGETPMGVIQQVETNLYVGGDWSYGASVQSAFKTAFEIAQTIIRQKR